MQCPGSTGLQPEMNARIVGITPWHWREDHEALDPPYQNHGHVHKRDDDYTANCGGPILCNQCRLEQQALDATGKS